MYRVKEDGLQTRRREACKGSDSASATPSLAAGCVFVLGSLHRVPDDWVGGPRAGAPAFLLRWEKSPQSGASGAWHFDDIHRR